MAAESRKLLPGQLRARAAVGAARRSLRRHRRRRTLHEFDLDFVITSERDWACYAELPGVAIAQLQRREGIDAVHVSRWTWDDRARRREGDPDRRFAPVPAVAALAGELDGSFDGASDGG